MTVVTIDIHGQVRLPDEWLKRWGHPSSVALEETESGILIRPCQIIDWDTILSQKLTPFSIEAESEAVTLERSDLLF